LPEVEVIQVEQKDIPIWKKWVGTLDGLVDAQIKPQVTGLSTSPDLQGRLACKKKEPAFRDRSQNFPSGAG
jgi:membrane fusion protein (multidrug efflux system)